MHVLALDLGGIGFLGDGRWNDRYARLEFLGFILLFLYFHDVCRPDFSFKWGHFRHEGVCAKIGRCYSITNILRQSSEIVENL